jgi:hypothetical protein
MFHACRGINPLKHNIVIFNKSSEFALIRIEKFGGEYPPPPP